MTRPNLSRDPRDHEPLRPDSNPAKTDYVEVQLMLARQQLGEAAARQAEERNQRHRSGNL